MARTIELVSNNIDGRFGVRVDSIEGVCVGGSMITIYTKGGHTKTLDLISKEVAEQLYQGLLEEIHNEKV